MKPEVSDQLDKLGAELEGLPPDYARRLRPLVEDLKAELTDREQDGPTGLIETIRESITEFEVEHPRTTAILNDILIKLESMGI